MEEEVEVPQDMKVGPAKVNGLLFNIPLWFFLIFKSEAPLWTCLSINNLLKHEFN